MFSSLTDKLFADREINTAFALVRVECKSSENLKKETLQIAKFNRKFVELLAVRFPKAKFSSETETMISYALCSIQFIERLENIKDATQVDLVQLLKRFSAGKVKVL